MKKFSQILRTQLLNDFFSQKTVIFLFIHAVLLILAWHSEHTAFLVFFAFIPVFFYLDYSPESYNEKVKLYIFSFLAVFLWIYYTIFWIKPINPISHFIITLLSAAVLFVPYLLSYYFRFSNKKSSLVSKILFISAWVVIELCHDLNLLGFPYLNLGHTLAAYPLIIQWYKWTGSIGGTIWIIFINLSLYHLVRYLISIRQIFCKNSVWQLVLTISVVVVPIILSVLLLKNSSKGDGTSFNAVCVHTSVYDYKYEVDSEILLEGYLKLTLNSIDSTKQNLIVWPETALTGYLKFHEVDSDPLIIRIKRELCNNTNNVLIVGANVDELVDSPDSNCYLPNIMYDKDDHYFFRRYNAALFMRSEAPTLIETKKRLVPLAEKIPSKRIFSPLVSLWPHLAEHRLSSKPDEYVVFSTQKNSIRTCPIICYDVAFSDHVAEKILRTKSNLIVALMNEGYMGSEKVNRHLNWFSVCRAIENRQQIVKSSNEGTSAIINSKGEMEESVTGVSEGVIQSRLHINDNYTFYTRYHSQINYVLLIVALIFIIVQFLIPNHKNQ